MNSPRTPDELATAIEQLVSSFIDAGRLAAQEALARSFAQSEPVRASRPRRQAAVVKAPSARRSGAEMQALAERLLEAVWAEPGESMTRYSAQLGVGVRQLHRAMQRLKGEGRVRSVGERHQTRYFPTVGRRGPG